MDLDFATNDELMDELKKRARLLVLFFQPEHSDHNLISTVMKGPQSELVWIIEQQKLDFLLERRREQSGSSE